MNRMLALLTVMLFCTSSYAQSHLPPSSVQEESKNVWYSPFLKAMGESVLSAKANGQSYRFLWLRTFHRPVMVRLDVHADGTGMVTLKETSGQGGYEPGKLRKVSRRKLSRDQTQGFLTLVEELKYWDLSSTEQPKEDGETVVGLDGAQWILEGSKGKDHKVVERWSPEDGALKSLGLTMLLDLAGLKLLYREVY
jgi:hypothetical protein